ncbi:MAG: triose-phosphate isomerase [Dethiobacteria bacterium]|nr:triose-phosphate isomerase [Dethiobacteria bacterium]
MELIIAGNWKMHKTAAETAVFCREISRDAEQFSGVEVLVCPPYTSLAAAQDILKGSKIKLGAQNLHFAQQGAYTGEIAAPMLLELGVEYVIIGHSERRHLMGETDDLVRQKVKAALDNGLKPILCVGETEAEREDGLTEIAIEKQLTGALEGLSAEETENLVVAYEPVWAIGTGKAASTDDAESAAALIRSFFKDKLGEKASASLRIQYGGSVKAENIASYLALPSVQGALVGGASLEAESFSTLVKAARKAE